MHQNDIHLSYILVFQDSTNVASPKKEYDIDDKPQKSLNEKQQVLSAT
jgi:myosin-5